MKTSVFSGVLLASLFLFSGIAAAVERYVPGEYATIQAAIDASVNGDTVVIAPGTYTDANNTDLDFGGKAITVSSSNPEDPCVVAATIIDCNGSPNEPHRGFIFQSGEDGNSVLDGVTIKNGFVFTGGGGIYCTSDPTIKNCIITNNIVAQDPCLFIIGDGAGISLNDSSATIIGCKITFNSSAYNCWGGGIYCSGNPTIKDCIIRNNTTEGRGGGISLYEGIGADIINCLIVDNTASVNEYGGGIACKRLNPNIVNCTISGNYAGRGGAIDIISATATITNSVLWGDSINEITKTGTGFAVVSYSDIEGGYSGSGNIDANPLFASSSDYHLTFGSPCIDFGTNSPPGGLEPNDIEGNTRPFDGDLNGTATADMGAYEFRCNPGEPMIALTPASFKFSCPAGGPDPNSRTLYIWNPGGGTLNWQITEDANWLSINPSSGQCTVDTNEVTVSVECNDLASDLYMCDMTVSDSNNTRIVSVSFRVGPTIHVPSDYNNIQAAIDAAFDGDTIVVADGTYTGVGNRDIDFKAKAITVESENGPEICVIDCNGTAEENHRGFYFHSGEGEDSKLDGFTVINGYYYEGALAIGGGIFCINEGTEPTISNCILTDNEASHGGGMGCYRSSPRIMNCMITKNEAGSHYGGGFYLWDSSLPIITGCTIADSSAVYGGGAIYSGYNSHPEIASSIIWNNSSSSGEDEISGSATISFSDVMGGYSGTGNISTDPCFIDSSNGDYHLRNNSPCIDSGDPCYMPAPYEMDIDGQPRLMGDSVDMGADEISDLLGDLDASDDVSYGDISLFADSWLSDDFDESCDLILDNTITFKDYAVIANNWGKERDSVAPSAPTNLTVTDTTATTVSLSWNASTDNLCVAGYIIYKDGDYTGWTDETVYTDTELDPSTIYTYTVSAYDAAYNESAAADSVQAMTNN